MPTTNDRNEGYIITGLFETMPGHGIAVARREKIIVNDPSPWVTWEYGTQTVLDADIRYDETSYYWGHYFADKYEATKDFCSRIYAELDIR